MEWFIDAYGDSFVVAPTAQDARPQEQAKQPPACSSVFTFPMNARKKGSCSGAELSPRASGSLQEPLLVADGTCAIYMGDRIVTEPSTSASSKQQAAGAARRQQPNRALCSPLLAGLDDMVVTIIARSASASASSPSAQAAAKLGLQPPSPDIQRDTLPPARDQAPVAPPAASAAPPPAASKSFSYSQQHHMQDPFAAASGGNASGAPQLRSFSSLHGRSGYGSGGGAPPAGHGSASCGGAPPASGTGASSAVGGLHSSGSQLHTWQSTEWWRNMSSSRLNEMADAEDPRSPEMRKIPYVGGAAPMCALCHGDESSEREQQQVASVLQQHL
ncbi:hypothetical protein HYH02_005792 [Chlamydomonas schloesseri]|uniref:Uncharacterized protein n=1 Tax=Chlamydomonas schloesseri TaxID=2026947 RepID=A0A835WL47_9CHLO|nr:hypothetical protein HYH02_005792 [Chlamydomonas schloesseri]|eukprot:KAG2449041.1 hypothetical protein HYH02_005792 [Chlamydomonas schloesseri]